MPDRALRFAQRGPGGTQVWQYQDRENRERKRPVVSEMFSERARAVIGR